MIGCILLFMPLTCAEGKLQKINASEPKLMKF